MASYPQKAHGRKGSINVCIHNISNIDVLIKEKKKEKRNMRALCPFESEMCSSPMKAIL